MNIIPLPPVLPGNLDLADINRQLLAGTAQLDWSTVISAPESALQVLLANLDALRHADALGMDDGAIADDIAIAVSRHLAQELTSKEPSPPAQTNPPAPSVKPALWSAPIPPPDPEPQAEAESSTTEPEEQTDHTVEPPTDSVEPKPLQELKVATDFDLRRLLEKRVLNDLLGPAKNDAYEEIDEGRVSDRYLVGLLAPLHRRQRQDSGVANLERPEDDSTSRLGSVDQNPEELDELAVAGTDSSEEGQNESGNAITETMFPSSIGMTFCVCGNAKALTITAGWGQYTRTKSESTSTPSGNAKIVWKRIPIRNQSPPIPLREGIIDDWQIDPDYGVFVRGQIRRQDNDWIISLFLLNGQTEAEQQPDQSWVFQPELSVKSADIEYPDIFIQRPQHRRADHKLDALFYAEEQDMQMLYRKQVEFAIGHGVGVYAEVHPDDTTRAVEISSRVVPTYEVPKTTPPTVNEIPELAGLVLSMQALAETPAEALSSKLEALPAAYAHWITTQRSRLNEPDLANHQEAAHRALDNCDRALERIREGLEMLRTQPQAAHAFQFMNRAMYLQRVRSLYAAQVRQGEEGNLEAIAPPTWYPFQLAFILLNLPSTTDLHHPDRSHETQAVADLLWFPTGGGKTEAYLGLAAYTIGLRRLQGTIGGRSGEAGVAVLMRYTLRLLTLQQFQRATALICACEVIRREDEDTLGERTLPHWTVGRNEYDPQPHRR